MNPQEYVAFIDSRIYIAGELRPRDRLTTTALALTKVLIFPTIVLLPVAAITTFVGRGLRYLFFGGYDLLFLVLWLPFMGLLAGTSWLWLRMPITRPLLLIPGPILAVISHTFSMLLPDKFDTKYGRSALADIWPLSWYVLVPPDGVP